MDPMMMFNAGHYIDPRLKNSDWGANIMWQHYMYGGAKSLLDGKDPHVIRNYAEGNQNMKKYRKMFKRLAKTEQEIPIGDDLQATGGAVKDITGIDWEPLGLMTQPLNAAISILQKTPIYVKCTAIDALAQDKKKKDYNFLKNRPLLDKDLGDISQKLKTPMGTPAPQNNATNVDITNFDLDPTKEDELNFFFDMFHKLRPESAFEAALMALTYTLELKNTKDLEIRDHFLYGVSTNRANFSEITALPTASYEYPGNIFTPPSDLDNYNDAPYRYIKKPFTVEEVMNCIGSDLKDGDIEYIMNSYFDSMSQKQRWSDIPEKERKRQSIPMVYMEFKTWDAINFHKKKSPSGFMINEIVPFDYELRYGRNWPDASLRGKPKPATDDEFITTKYVQKTMCGYFFNFYPTPRCFRFKELEGAYREAGRESMSPFSINIEKSQAKGAVEQCIPIIDDAQRAYFKMQHCIIMSKPKGMYIDLRFMRQAVANLASTDMKMGLKQLFTLFSDNNIFLGDSDGMDPNEMASGARPFYEISGGVGVEIEGYLKVIQDAGLKIAKLTGINDAVTGQSPNPDGLVGLQKLLLQSGINSFYYAQNAIKKQTEKVFRMWGHQIQYILKHRNSASAKAIEAIIGAYKVDVIRDLHTLPVHQFGIMVENAPNEQEQAELNQMLMEMFQSGRITSSDWVTLRRIFNYKDAAQLMAIRERKNKEREDQVRAQQIAAGAQGEQMKQQGKLANTQMLVQGDQQVELMKSQTLKWLAQFDAQMEQTMARMDAIYKGILQDARGRDQLNKTRELKNSAESGSIPV